MERSVCKVTARAIGCALALLAGAAASAAPLDASGPPTTVVLVRHAEKAAEPKTDPVLSAAGEARAQALARRLARAGVVRILVSDRQRTRLTATPLAAALGLEPEAIPADDPSATAATILARPGGTVLVVGHSNTLGPIIEALGGGAIEPIAETSYDDFYVVTLSAGCRAAVLHLTYEGS